MHASDSTDHITLPESFLEVIDPRGGRREVRVDQSPFLIGRGAETGNHLQLEDKRISRVCAALIYSGGEFRLEDRGQRLGIFVNGKKTGDHPMSDGDAITFGATDSIQLIFHRRRTDRSLPRILSSLEQAASLEGGSRDLRQLSLLLEATSLLQSRMPLEEVLGAMVDRAITITTADRGLLLEADGSGQLRPLFARQKGALPLDLAEVKPSQTAIAHALTKRSSVVEGDVELAEAVLKFAQSVVGQQLRAVIAIPLLSHAAAGPLSQSQPSPAGELLGVLYLDSRRPAAFSGLERQILDALALEAASVLDNTRLLKKDRERQRMEREIAIAREIQQALLPKILGSQPHVQVAGINQSCLEVGGDYFDLIELENGRTAFLIADVAGKGLGAALVTALLQGTFSALTLGQEPGRVITHINRFLCSHEEVGRPATLFFGILDSDGKLEYANAGHPLPLLIRGDQVQSVFPAESCPVGMFAEEKFKTSFSKLEPGDTLVLFTDGISDAISPQRDRFGFDRLEKVVAMNTGASLEALQAAILAAVEEFTRGEPQADDITLLMVRFLGTKPGNTAALP
ncbi:MAG TPA: SpoIIE family protein phosphatase [Terriglobia bacterium]|nr:SpoIIE family protein phosphatase [Terriglobia bacterium]